MTTTHTPGPWKDRHLYFDKYSQQHHHAVVDRQGVPVALTGIVGAEDDAVSQANARLIAQAPLMLAALYALTHPSADDADVDFASDVIAQATGVRPADPRTAGEDDNDDSDGNPENEFRR